MRPSYLTRDMAKVYFVLLLGTILFVLFLPIQNSYKIDSIKQSAITKYDVKEEVKTEVTKQVNQIPKPKDGYTPVKGVDYTDGAKGDKGDTGAKGDSIVGAQGTVGATGLSAYEIAVKNGFVGTEQDWLDSLHSPLVMPEWRCSPTKFRLEYRLSSVEAWKVYIYNGAIVLCLGL